MFIHALALIAGKNFCLLWADEIIACTLFCVYAIILASLKNFYREKEMTFSDRIYSKSF